MTAKGHQRLLVAQILGPCFELLRGSTNPLSKMDKRFTKAVWVEVRQADRSKCFLENGSNWTRAAPVLAVQSHRSEPKVVAYRDLSGRKQRIVEAPKLFLPQIDHPIGDYRADVIAYREERGDE